MPFYECPKCGSNDTYQGTEISFNNKSGGGFVGLENESGITPYINVSGKQVQKEITVHKCRKCDCLLGQKDLRYTPSEKAVLRDRTLRIRKKKKIINTVFITFIGVVLSFIGVVLFNVISLVGFITFMGVVLLYFAFAIRFLKK